MCSLFVYAGDHDHDLDLGHGARTHDTDPREPGQVLPHFTTGLKGVGHNILQDSFF